MPFQSEKQRRYLWANEPEIARDWTNTYGSRIRKDNGGVALQGGGPNYLGEQPEVTAPKYWQSSPDHEAAELAYITPTERDILIDLDIYGSLNGKPNRGPSGIMSLQGDLGGYDASPGGPDSGGGGGHRVGQGDPQKQRVQDILRGNVTTGQTVAVSDRTRQHAVPEYARGPDGKMKYIGSGFKSAPSLFNPQGYRSIYNKRGLFGGPDIRFNRGAGEYQFKDPRTGNVKPGWGGRLLGGLASILTGIPFVGGAIGSAIDHGKGIFGQKPRDMSPYRNLGLFGQVPEDYNRIEYYNRNKTPMDRIDPWTKQGITGLDAYETFDDDVAASKELANLLTNRDQFPAYEEFDEVAERDFPTDENIAAERFVGLEHMSTYDKVEYNALKKNKALGIKLTPEKEKRLKELQKKRDAKGITEEGTAIV
jgi:hypothetical protein